MANTMSSDSTTLMVVRISTDQKDKIKENASKLGYISASEYIRAIIKTELARANE